MEEFTIEWLEEPMYPFDKKARAELGLGCKFTDRVPSIANEQRKNGLPLAIHPPSIANERQKIDSYSAIKYLRTLMDGKILIFR